ncbi:MAG TPA: molybdenum cofactor biosynthesis protein MoaE [Chthoniobacterales bacterium]|nr:molybdenum cofactor biosynthesis protein MoaE [Chthoniobacterales bacterium]
MANAVCIVLVTEAALQNPPDEVVDPSAGAVVDFWGVVRKLEDGCEIDGIEYETHQIMAEHQMQRIAAEAIEKFGLNELLLHHRIGFVRASEASLFLRVRASHRAAAFEASKWIVDDLKRKVPIWKKPVFSMPKGPAAQIPSRTSIAATAPK